MLETAKAAGRLHPDVELADVALVARSVAGVLGTAVDSPVPAADRVVEPMLRSMRA